jgi:hypothetical protein
MTTYSGVLKIARFNWPWYAAAVATTVTGIFLLRSGVLGGPWTTLGTTGLFLANFWLLVSLAVSHYVYDRSAVSRGEWLRNVDTTAVRRVAIFHAGQDEASDVVARVLPAADIKAFDFYDPSRNGTSSLQRARTLTDSHGVSIAPDSIPLNDSMLDLGFVVFAAHEIRDRDERSVFFREVARALAPAGRILVVEHLRDVWNFLAFGPGAFHFFSRRTWGLCFSDAGLKPLRESSCTRFVRVIELGKAS